jgi:hypothetical protein
MGTIHVAIKGDPCFEWDANPAEIDSMDEQLGRLAETGGMAVERMTLSAVVAMVKTGGFLAGDPQSQRGQSVMMTHFLLNLPTGNPEHPGRYRDYLPAWQFFFDIQAVNEETGEMSMTVQGVVDGETHTWVM